MDFSRLSDCVPLHLYSGQFHDRQSASSGWKYGGLGTVFRIAYRLRCSLGGSRGSGDTDGEKAVAYKGGRCSRCCQRADQSGSVGDSCNARVYKTGPGTQIFYDQHHLWGTGNVYRSKPCTSGSGHSRRRHHVTGDRTPSRI